MTDQPGTDLQPMPTRSTEKVWGLILYLQDSEPEELAEAFPFRIPEALLRTALAAAGDGLPDNDADLDAFLTSVSEFCLSLRSDDYGA